MHSSSTKGQRVFCVQVLHNKDIYAKILSPCVSFGSTLLNSFLCIKPDAALHILCNQCLPYIFSTGSQIMWFSTSPESVFSISLFLFIKSLSTFFYLFLFSSVVVLERGFIACLGACWVQLKATVAPRAAMPKPAQHWHSFMINTSCDSSSSIKCFSLDNNCRFDAVFQLMCLIIYFFQMAWYYR